MLKTQNEYQTLTNQVINILSSKFHSMLYKNDFVELGKIHDLGKAKDFVFGVYMYQTNQPHMLVMVKSPEQDEYKYIDFSAEEFDVDLLLKQIIQMVTSEFYSLAKEDQYVLVEGIALTLKTALGNFHSPVTTLLQEEVMEDMDFKVAFTYDKYFNLTSKSYLYEFLNESNEWNVI